jgi:hypothetical protein
MSPPDGAATPNEPAPRKPGRWRRLAPWMVAIGTLAWLFARVPLDELRAALDRAPMAAFIAYTVAYVPIVLALDTLATWATFRWSLPDSGLTYRETLDIRGASYLLALLHYGAGQGGIAWFVSRLHHVPLARAAGAVMLIMGVNVIVVALCALVGVLLGGAPSATALRWLVLGMALAFPVYLAVIAARPAFLSKLRLLAPLFDAGLKGHAVAVAARLPHIVWLVVAQYFAMRFFDITPPFGVALTLLPIVFVVAVLPISPSGIGTAQATAVALFSDHAPRTGDPRATVLACFLAFQVLALLVQALIGLVFLRRLTRAGIVEKEGTVS